MKKEREKQKPTRAEKKKERDVEGKQSEKRGAPNGIENSVCVLALCCICVCVC